MDSEADNAFRQGPARSGSGRLQFGWRKPDMALSGRSVLRVGIALVGLALGASAALASSLSKECLNFDAYKAEEIFRGPYADANLTATALAGGYRTVIQEGSKGPPTFAGHLRVIKYGCGSNCIRFILVDRRSGDVIEVPEGAANGAVFRPESRLFVIDHPDLVHQSYGDTNPWGMWPIALEWKDDSRKLVPIDNCDEYKN